MEEPQTESQIQPSTDLPPLLALPLELKFEILSKFSDAKDDDDEGVNKLALTVLRRTHSSFRRIIPKTKPTYELLLLAENEHPYLFPWICENSCSGRPHSYADCFDPDSMLPCYDCLQLRECIFFRADPARRGDLNEVLGDEDAGTRTCDECYHNECDG